LIFELWSNGGKNRGRHLHGSTARCANEIPSGARRLDVGSHGGSRGKPERTHLVATLETQKNRLIQGDGPALLVVDEYR